jgi:hypothetical protein
LISGRRESRDQRRLRECHPSKPLTRAGSDRALHEIELEAATFGRFGRRVGGGGHVEGQVRGAATSKIDRVAANEDTVEDKQKTV